MNDIEKLSLHSTMAKEYGNNYDVVWCDPERGLSFHPNGNCGCLQLNDEYAFGIRCNHLIWAEGNCEGVEDFWTENDHKIANEKLKRNDYNTYNTILVYGNHKGTLLSNLIIFHEK